MKYKVRIEGRTFEAEVGNVDARPIVVMVEGERFEVWPERLPAPEGTRTRTAPCAEDQGEEAEGAEGIGTKAPRSGTESPPRAASEPAAQHTPSGTGVPALGFDTQVRAPIPGVIDSVAVRPGNEVATGDPLCVIEAMKMKNVIRASRVGIIDEVLVTPGQHVKHGDVLVAFVA